MQSVEAGAGLGADASHCESDLVDFQRLRTPRSMLQEPESWNLAGGCACLVYMIVLRVRVGWRSCSTCVDLHCKLSLSPAGLGATQACLFSLAEDTYPYPNLMRSNMSYLC